MPAGKIINVEDFSPFGLSEDILNAVDTMGYRVPTPIQQEAIPVILNGEDLIGCAQTGTGKTAAFLLPVLNYLVTHPSEKKGMRVLVVVPTRELAQQIDQQLMGLSYFLPVSSISIYGGGDGMGWDQQKVSLTGGTDIVIATPGRILSHLNLGYVKTDSLSHLILDEADRMLDMGFHDDIMKILEHLPENRQTLMFSATMPPKIRQMAKKILNHPRQVNIAVSKPADNILQTVYMVHEKLKPKLIVSLFSGKDIDSAIIFASTKQKVKEITKSLKLSGLNAGAIHSDLEQKEREAALLDFRNRKVPVLVATDIISRGIDVEGIELIINYDVPGDPEDYVHRVGRTARAERSGLAITFVSKSDEGRLARLEQFLESRIFRSPLPELS